jgi:hypothetical protein
MLDFVRYMVVWFPIIMTAMYVMLHVMHLDENGQRIDGAKAANGTAANGTLSLTSANATLANATLLSGPLSR